MMVSSVLRMEKEAKQIESLPWEGGTAAEEESTATDRRKSHYTARNT